MSILLYIIGAITLVLGALTLGFGIPDKEFSFGNTLIVSGTTAVVGGLIVIALGAVVSHLQRLADVIAMRAPLRPVRPADLQEAGRTPAASRIPFPSRSSSETEPEEAPPVEPPLTGPVHTAAPGEEPAVATEAPMLPNPDIPLAEPAEEVPLPAPPFAAAPPVSIEPGEPAAPSIKPAFGSKDSGAEESAPAWLSARHAPPPVQPPRAPKEANFEAVWPAAEGRMASRPAVGETQPGTSAPPETEPEALAGERRTAAILKSGVVDGMAYTLYVDGSIEAELPQGTLRFASINDLREHLEKTA